jgi:hypothetical protein
VFGEAAAAAPPSNDTCAQAQPITLPGLNTAQTFTGTTIDATSDLGQSCALGDNLDVWFRFTAPATGTYTFDTVNSTIFDTTLALYSTCGGPSLACNDNIDAANFNFWSAVSISLSAGQSVLVRVSAALGDSDDFVLNVYGVGAVTNDACANAFTITLNQVVTGSTLNATTDFALPAAACGSEVGSGGGKDVFFAFTPTATGPYLIRMCGSAFDTVLAVLSDCSGSPASVLACNDDSVYCATQMNSEIPLIQLTAGVRYLIRVAGYDYGPPADSGVFTLTIGDASSGICCRGATCSPIPAASCVPLPGNGGARYVNHAQACNAPGQFRTPCCYVDYNKDGVVGVQDVFDFLNDWFSMRATAIVGGNGNPGVFYVQQIFDFLNAFFAGC